uniref:Uncharacterized protein n=1 Tax=Echinococcus granulosus TaxID=6210 RepID=A0A068X520_ECHGR|nr:hypothetical protein EgrG_002061000 [Echinococcus granulosus]
MNLLSHSEPSVACTWRVCGALGSKNAHPLKQQYGEAFHICAGADVHPISAMWMLASCSTESASPFPRLRWVGSVPNSSPTTQPPMLLDGPSRFAVVGPWPWMRQFGIFRLKTKSTLRPPSKSLLRVSMGVVEEVRTEALQQSTILCLLFAYFDSPKC